MNYSAIYGFDNPCPKCGKPVGDHPLGDRCPPMTDRTEANIAERLRLTEGGLELLLVAAKAGDPQREIIWRIEEELRQIRRPFAVVATESGGAT